MAKAKKTNKKKNRWLMLFVSFAACLVLSVVGGYFALLYAGAQMIDMSKLDELKKDASVVYDKDGNAVFTLHMKEDRNYVPYNKIPKHVIEAFVAIEDKRFFEHNGVDFVRIAGAILKDIQTGSAKEGGSTITQQLARQVFLSDEKTFWRKTKEVSIAINLDRTYTKEQILEMYLNKIYMGEGAYGIEAASKVYFDKSIIEGKEPLTIAEAAALAATPKAPSYYGPFGDKNGDQTLAKERRDTIIRVMYEQKLITLDEKEAAQKEPMPVPREVTDQQNNKAYRAYMDYVISEAEEKYGIDEAMLYKGGWKIYTAMDKQMQDAMITAFNNPKNFPKDGAKYPAQAAMIAVDPKTGGIAGMMGGRNYVAKGFNYAVDAKRQPGSSFKPIVAYAPALDTDNKYHPYYPLSNQLQDFNGYKPRNYNNKYSESVPMAEALKQSLNVPTVWLLDKIGVKTGMNYAERFGIKLAPEDRNLAIALGGLHTGTSPLKMAQAYTAFANGGIMSEAHAIVSIKEEQLGIQETVQLKQTPVIKPQTAWDVHTMMRAAVEQGTGKAAKMNRPVSGKTGTTQSGISKSTKDNKDVWFVGYTAEYVGAVWMGYEKEDKQHILRNGSDLPAKLFKTVFTEGLKGRKVTEFTKPQGVDEVEKKEEETANPLTLTADMTMVSGELKVVLSWIGGNEEYVSYDIYRYADSIDNKELIQSGWTDTIFMDSIKEPIPYKYLVIPRKANGEEGAPSEPKDVNMSQLQNLLQDGALHNDENVPGDEGELPPNGEDSDQGDNPDQQGDDSNPEADQPAEPANGGNSNRGNGESDGNGSLGNPGNNSTTPPWLDTDQPPGDGQNHSENGNGNGNGNGNR